MSYEQSQSAENLEHIEQIEYWVDNTADAAAAGASNVECWWCGQDDLDENGAYCWVCEQGQATTDIMQITNDVWKQINLDDAWNRRALNRPPKMGRSRLKDRCVPSRLRGSQDEFLGSLA
ncbi:hypothetical protein ACEPPN_017624 [Leptodophora sp. 'Broadleaf-Isolate-01']